MEGQFSPLERGLAGGHKYPIPSKHSSLPSLFSKQTVYLCEIHTDYWILTLWGTKQAFTKKLVSYNIALSSPMNWKYPVTEEECVKWKLIVIREKYLSKNVAFSP